MSLLLSLLNHLKYPNLFLNTNFYIIFSLPHPKEFTNESQLFKIGAIALRSNKRSFKIKSSLSKKRCPSHWKSLFWGNDDSMAF